MQTVKIELRGAHGNIGMKTAEEDGGEASDRADDGATGKGSQNQLASQRPEMAIGSPLNNIQATHG